MPPTPGVRARIALLVTVVAWAAAFPAIRVGLDGFGPAGLTVARLLVASVALAAAAPLLGVRRPAARDLPAIALCGVTGMAAYNLLLNWGEVEVPAGTASFIVITNPIYSAVLAVVLLGERINRRQVAGAALALCGIAVITLANGLRVDVSALIVLCAAVAFGVYHVAIKPLLGRYTGLEVTAYATWAGTVLVAPAAPSMLSGLEQADAGAIGAAVFLGLVPSALGFLTWSYAVARLPVTVATNALYLVPVIALAVGFGWLGEEPGGRELLGGAVALAGVVLATRRPLNRNRGPRAATGIRPVPGPNHRTGPADDVRAHRPG